MKLSMDIPLIRTVQCLGEMPTNGHAPVRFLCDDGHEYFCKYRKRLTSPEEIDFLGYELAGTLLLKQLGIPTPEVAFVEVVRGSFERRQVPQNGTHMAPGVVMFGSRRMKGDVVPNTHRFQRKKDFKLLLDPLDLLRIALFDLWAENTDRGKPLDQGHNFNLLMVPEKRKLRLVPIDHGFLFGGEGGLSMLNPRTLHPRVDNKLFLTPLFADVMGNLAQEEKVQAMNSFLTSLSQLDLNELRTTLQAASAHWPMWPALPVRLTTFLTDRDRCARVEHLARSYFTDRT